MKVVALVEKGGRRSFSCRLEQSISKHQLIGYGTSAKEAMDDLEVTCQEMASMFGDDSFLGLEKDYRFDVGALFDFYSFLNIEGIAKLSGISASVLRQYASGVRTPREDKLKALEAGLHAASRQINSVVLCA